MNEIFHISIYKYIHKPIYHTQTPKISREMGLMNIEILMAKAQHLSYLYFSLHTELTMIPVADPGGSRGPSPPPYSPFLRPQITPFYTQMQKFSKKCCLALLFILFKFSINIF